jgi:hypothetical protein
MWLTIGLTGAIIVIYLLAGLGGVSAKASFEAKGGDDATLDQGCSRSVATRLRRRKSMFLMGSASVRGDVSSAAILTCVMVVLFRQARHHIPSHLPKLALNARRERVCVACVRVVCVCARVRV